jgi:hypothetical protein
MPHDTDLAGHGPFVVMIEAQNGAEMRIATSHMMADMPA